MKIFTFNIAAFVAVLASMLLASPASAGVAVQFIESNTSLLCEGEQIDIQGRLKVVDNTDYNGGRLNLFVKFGYSGKGYSQFSGAEYIAQQQVIESVHDVDFSPPIPTVYIYNDVAQLIGKGNAPDYRARVKVKFVIANDTVVVDTVEFEPGSCVFL